MELDHLKEMWSNENVAETPEISTESQKEIHLPLERIRKNGNFCCDGVDWRPQSFSIRS